MRDMTAKLRNLVEVWKQEEYTTELEEIDSREVFLKKAYCSVRPLTARELVGVAGTEANSHKYKFIFRKRSVPDIQKDWFFIYQGEKYDVTYFNEDFKTNEFIEVFCTRWEE